MIRIYLAILAAISTPAAARAQERGPFEMPPGGPLLRADVAGSRQTERFEPIGIDAGPLKVLPALRLRAVADSNVVGSSTEKRGDVFVGFEPEVAAAYGHGNLSIVARANAAIARYAKLTSQNRNAFGAGTDVRLAIEHRTTATVAAAFARAYEPNQSVEAAESGITPARFDEIKGQAALSSEFGAARATATASFSRRDYASITNLDGTTADQSFRDARTVTLAGNGELATRVGPTILAEANLSWIDASHPSPCCDRTSTTARFMLGLRGELTPLVRFEALGGHITRDYATTSFSDYSGAIWRARLEWYATPLITVAVSTARDLVSGGVPDAAGVKVDSSQLKIYYELRRDIDVTLSMTHADEDYRGTGMAIRDNAIDLAVSYLFKPRRTSGGYLRWHDRESNSTRLDTAGSAVEGGVWFRLAI